MFTGIIEEIGEVKQIRMRQSGIELSILGDKVAGELKIGDSIAIDGACLTVAEAKIHTFKVFVSRETLANTNLGKIKTGTRVNLERAMSLDERIGGHLVTGHVDTTGAIKALRKAGECLEVEIMIPKQDSHLVVPKGSVAVDGVSLTAASLKDNIIKLVVIPHTLKATTLGLKRTGALVNIEYDLIGKYLLKFYERENKGSISMDFLKEKGFV